MIKLNENWPLRKQFRIGTHAVKKVNILENLSFWHIKQKETKLHSDFPDNDAQNGVIENKLD